MDDIKQRFTGSLPKARRCSSCQKVLYFSVMKCRTCGLVAHKHCYGDADHHYIKKTNSANSCGTIPVVTENFDERLHDPEHHQLQQQPLQPRRESYCHPGTTTTNTPKYRTMSDSSYDYDFNVPNQSGRDAGSAGAAMTGLLRIIRWLSHKRKAKELNCKNNPAALEKHVKSRFGLHPKLADKEAKKKLKALLKSTQNYQRQLYHGGSNQPVFYQQQQQYYPLQRHRFSSARSASTSGPGFKQRRLFRSMAIRSDSAVSSPRSSVSSSTDYATPHGTPTFGNDRTTVPDERNDASSVKRTSPISLEPSSRANRSQPKNNQVDFVRQQEPPQQKSAAASSSSSSSKQVLLPECSGWTFGMDCSSDGRGFQGTPAANTNKTTAVSKTLKLNKPPPIITKAKTLSIESHGYSNESLCATWPPAGKGGTISEETSDEGEYVEANEDASSTLSLESPRREEALKEWSIPYDDLEFADRVRHGRHGDIFKGRWYGEVLIYTIRDSGEGHVKKFLDDVHQMGMIRHENIVLFMGACIKPPRLAVITSMRKGPTLYEYVHLKRNRLPFHSKLNIARQIAQGMGYLHAKGITHRKLNSKNIFLESRVKLCMMDHAMADRSLDRNDRGCIPRGQLTYISPELMRTLQIEPPRIYPTATFTQSSDIFAFGSLLYELLAERFPFHDQPAHAVIWKIATGKRASLEHFRFINGLKALIRKCWSQTPQNRPPFLEIVNKLLENVSNHKRHSSVPDKLHFVSHSMRRNICT